MSGAVVLAIAALLLLPDRVLAGGSMDQMSPQELERFVHQLNYEANWRKYRRPSDPPDFVPGKPIRVMRGAGSAFASRRGGAQAGAFRRSGLGSRRRGLTSRRNSREERALSSRGASSSRSRSNFGSTFGESSLGSSSRRMLEQGQ